MTANTNRPTSYTIPVATNTRSQPRQSTASTRVKGCDLLELTETAAGQVYKLGTPVVRGMVTAEASARLSTLSRAFQRIKWHNLRFTVEGAYSTASGGGYIACFVRDPTDQPPKDPLEVVRWAMAQQHSADSKWYESVGLNVGQSPDLLYTSVSDTPRLYSPGTLYIVSKGGPAQVGSLTVSFHWDITLSEPTIDSNPVTDSLKMPLDCGFLWLAATAEGMPLQYINTSSDNPEAVGFLQLKASMLGTNLEPGSLLTLAQPVVLTGHHSANDKEVAVQVTHLVVLSNGDVHGVVEVGLDYYVISTSAVTDLPGGFKNSVWSNVFGGYGTKVPAGAVLEVVGRGRATAPRASTQFGLRRVETTGKKVHPADYVTEVSQQQFPIVDLSGEQ